MSDTIRNNLVPMHTDGFTDANSLPGIIAALGELKPGAIVTEEGVAHLFNRHVASVKRAIERGELPPPCRLFGTRVWTARALIRHIESRLEHAAKDIARIARKIATLSP
jgi:hypothetical protein